MPTDVGKALRICRTKHLVSNAQVAEALGVAPQQASRIANTQHASTRTVEKLAALFDMKPSEFLAIGEE